MKFKVGDRVSIEAFSGVSWDGNGHILDAGCIDRQRGTIVSIQQGIHVVRYDKPDPRWPKSLFGIGTERMLRKLRKKMRRRVWVFFSPTGSGPAIASEEAPASGNPNWIEFIEVRTAKEQR